MVKAKVEPSEYETILLKIMYSKKISLADALDRDFKLNGVDVSSILDITDYLEDRLKNLNKVAYYMDVYTGNSSDVALKQHVEELKEKEKKSDRS